MFDNVAVLPGYVYPSFDEMCNLHRYPHKIDINKILVTLEWAGVLQSKMFDRPYSTACVGGV